MSDLTGKTALVTGATDGVGRPLALALAQTGAEVLVHGRDGARAEALLQEIAAAGGRAAFYPAELGELAQVHRLAELVARDHDRLDILVSNAGIGRGAPGTGREVSADGPVAILLHGFAGSAASWEEVAPLLADGGCRAIAVDRVGFGRTERPEAPTLPAPAAPSTR